MTALFSNYDTVSEGGEKFFLMAGSGFNRLSLGFSSRNAPAGPIL
jgi:hypothetical protein